GPCSDKSANDTFDSRHRRSTSWGAIARRLEHAGQVEPRQGARQRAADAFWRIAVAAPGAVAGPAAAAVMAVAGRLGADPCGLLRDALASLPSRRSWADLSADARQRAVTGCAAVGDRVG